MKLDPQAKRRYVNQMFGRIAERYDLLNAIMTCRRDASWRRATARLAANECPGAFLDVATGSGDLALELAALHPSASVYGVDFTAPMLRLAGSKAERRGLSARIAFVCGDALALPFPDATFKAATMGFALRNVADIHRAVSEVHRVLRPGGRFVNLELTHLPPGLRSSVFHLYFERLVPILGAIIARDLAAYRYLPGSLVGFPHAEALAAIVRDAGFAGVSYQLLGGGTVAIHVAQKN